MKKRSRREFLKSLRILPLLPPSLLILAKKANDYRPLQKTGKEAETLDEDAGIITKEAFTPLQTLASRIEPPKYDRQKFFRFFKRHYPGSEKFVPFVMEACEKHGKIYPMDPLLVMSQMYQESKFDPAAISWVGAGGLLQFMPYTAEEMGMENIYHPEYYKIARKKYRDANRAMRISNVYSDLLMEEARRDMKRVLNRMKRGPGDLSKGEIKEIRRELYRSWSGLSSAGRLVDVAEEESSEFLADSFGVLKESLNSLYEGLLDFVKRGSADKIEEAYHTGMYMLEDLFDELSALQDYYGEIDRKRRRETNILNRIFDLVLEEEKYEEIMKDVKGGYERYIDELRKGIFVNYRSGLRYRKGRFTLKEPEEIRKFDERFHEAANIDKGVKHDAALARKFHGNMAYAMCAFNSGVNNVYKTSRDPRTGKTIRITRIPFIRETITYWDNIYKNFSQWYPVVV